MTTTLDLLTAKFPAGTFTTSAFADNRRVVLAGDVAEGVLFEMLEALKVAGFDMLCDLGGIDYLNYPGASDRYAVVYALTNTASGERVFVKAYTNDPEPSLPSVTSLWKSADWMEREVYDLFGVTFPGHPDLRRILLPSEFTSHPLRKDYPLRGYGERHNVPVVTRAES